MILGMEALAPVEREHTQSRLPHHVQRPGVGPHAKDSNIGAVNDEVHETRIRNASAIHPAIPSSSRATKVSPPPGSARPQPLTTFPAERQPNVPSSSNTDNDGNTPKPRNVRRNAPVIASRKENNGPPLSMITQGYFDTLSPTTEWIADQSLPINTPLLAQNHSENPPPTPAVPKPSRLSSALIKPIRGFKPSSRRQSAEMERRSSQDADNTLRALEGLDNSYSHRSNREDPEEQNSDESDLFLRAAREEEQMSQQLVLRNGSAPSQADNRRSRTGPRGSLLQSNNSLSRRRGSDNESSTESRSTNEQEAIGQALTYRNTREATAVIDGTSRSRYYGSDTRSMPTTPRGMYSREISPPESQASYGGRRPSIPDPTLPSRSTYRASNLSYSTPRTYNSSPLVSRPEAMHDAPYNHRTVDGPESAVSAASTTAPSVVQSEIWDKMQEMQQRIHHLERANNEQKSTSRSSNDRPATATTTVTTISSSPRRARANSFSPSEQIAVETTSGELHPILQAALTKSKPFLSEDAYKALEATVSEALAITAMVGSTGKPGLFSSSQSVIGGPGSVTDRQARRKADNMCRSLTELCIALTEPKPDNQVAVRPGSRDREAQMALEPANNQRQLVSTDLARVKSSPRALSRLEARRSSLLATSNLPSPRYAPSESGTPTQSALAGRRTSLFLRSRRGGTEEPEEEDDDRFRAPSRAVTEVNGMRKSPREYTSQQPLPERQLPERQIPERQLPERQPPVQSSLPVRRHYPSTSLTNTAPTPMPPVSTLGGRRYLERSTPERDPQSLASRLAEDRGQRKSSISQSFGIGRTASLNRRTLQTSSGDFSTVGQAGGYK